ncbi:phage integrase [Yersinia vastinensis]|uniref:phage integrase n=1 Tax=Yersinia vastinensis TaxID=2890318 RepID=UPI003BB4D025
MRVVAFILLEKPADRRKLTELLDLWWIYHGKSHTRGEVEKGRLIATMKKLAAMGVIRADQLTKKNHHRLSGSLAKYRA